MGARPEAVRRAPAGCGRRDFLRAALAGGAALLSAGLPRVSRPAPSPRRRNLVLVVFDDQNDWVGCLGGHPDARTPHLDRLAARGLLFTRAYCCAPACNPSRTSLFTGIRPSTSGVYRNDQPWRPALPHAVALFEQLKRHGYVTAGAGKIYHYQDVRSWHRFAPRRAAPLPRKRPMNGIPGLGDLDWGGLDVADEAMEDAQTVTWAIGQIDGLLADLPASRPFALAVGTRRPHVPWYVPQRWLDRFPLEEVDLPETRAGDLDDVPAAARALASVDDHRRIVASGQWRQAVRGYLAATAFADAQIGRLFDALHARPALAENTVFAVCSDHGWHLGEKFHWRKGTLWEEATRVPLVFVAPGDTQPEARCARPVSYLDVYPTLLELLGLPAPSPLEGSSLRPLLADPTAPWERPALTTHGRGNHSVRSERWRYTRYADGGEELYDEASDPHEWVNLAGVGEHASVVRDLARWLPETDAGES